MYVYNYICVYLYILSLLDIVFYKYTNMRDLLVFGGSSNPDLTERICHNLGVKTGNVVLGKFSNGETQVMMTDSVREKDVYIIQSGCGKANDNLMELLVMISACKMASAKRITAVLPLFPYSRQPDVKGHTKGAPLLSKPRMKYAFESGLSTPRSGSRGPPEITNNNINNNNISNNNNNNSSRLSSTPFSPNKDNTNSRIFKNNCVQDSQPTVTTTNNASVEFLSSTSSTSGSSSASTLTGYKRWIAQSGTLIANLLTTAGADHIITMDLHDPQFQGFFDIPVDNLYSKPLLQHYIVNCIPDYQDSVIVSPDSGGAKRAMALADALGVPIALIHKERRMKVTSTNMITSPSFLNNDNERIMLHHTPSTQSLNNIPLLNPSPNNNNNNTSNNINTNSNNNIPTTPHEKIVATTMLVGDVTDKVCILIDDLVDTGHTISRAAKLLKDQSASKVYVLITHGLFSDDAIRRIKNSGIDKVITTNSVPQGEHIEEFGNDMIEILDISKVLSESIRRINNGESVSMLFDHGW